MMACLKPLGTQPEEREPFIIDNIKGLRQLHESFSSVEGIMSTGLGEGCICDTIGASSVKVIKLNWEKEGGGVILDLMVSILSVKLYCTVLYCTQYNTYSHTEEWSGTECSHCTVL